MARSTVVFVNIDWKASRHKTDRADKKNMSVLENTVRSIVETYEPVVICFCEVGEEANPLTLGQMVAVSELIEGTWHDLLQSTQLQRSFTEGYTYLTVWDASKIQWAATERSHSSRTTL